MNLINKILEFFGFNVCENCADTAHHEDHALECECPCHGIHK